MDKYIGTFGWDKNGKPLPGIDEEGPDGATELGSSSSANPPLRAYSNLNQRHPKPTGQQPSLQGEDFFSALAGMTRLTFDGDLPPAAESSNVTGGGEDDEAMNGTGLASMSETPVLSKAELRGEGSFKETFDCKKTIACSQSIDAGVMKLYLTLPLQASAMSGVYVFD